MNNLKLNAIFLKLPADSCQCMAGIPILFGASVDCYYFHIIFIRFDPIILHNQATQAWPIAEIGVCNVIDCNVLEYMIFFRLLKPDFDAICQSNSASSILMSIY